MERRARIPKCSTMKDTVCGREADEVFRNWWHICSVSFFAGSLHITAGYDSKIVCSLAYSKVNHGLLWDSFCWLACSWGSLLFRHVQTTCRWNSLSTSVGCSRERWSHRISSGTVTSLIRHVAWYRMTQEWQTSWNREAMGRKKRVSLQHHQMLCLPRKFTLSMMTWRLRLAPRCMT